VANITVSVPDAVYEDARLRAAEARTPVSALVRDYLMRVAYQDREFERLGALQAETLTQIRGRRAGYSAATRLTRDEVHDRDGLR